jgi:hypothetical protein
MPAFPPAGRGMLAGAGIRLPDAKNHDLGFSQNRQFSPAKKFAAPRIF